MFEACDGQTSLDEMAERVAARTGLPADRGIVELALSELDEVGLLSPVSSVPVGDSDAELVGSGLSRRSLIGRLALGAGAVALLPVVTTVLGSSQMAAATPARTQTALDSLVADPKTTSTTVGTPVDVTLTTTGGFVSPTSTIFAISNDPANGGVTLVDDVATYTPDPGFTGIDTFTYIAAQCIPVLDALPVLPDCPSETGPVPETGTAAATVTITVDPAPTTTTTSTAPPSSSTTTKPAASPAAATPAQPNFTG